jgi:hypothetical protein
LVPLVPLPLVPLPLVPLPLVPLPLVPLPLVPLPLVPLFVTQSQNHAGLGHAPKQNTGRWLCYGSHRQQPQLQ